MHGALSSAIARNLPFPPVQPPWLYGLAFLLKLVDAVNGSVQQGSTSAHGHGPLPSRGRGRASTLSGSAVMSTHDISHDDEFEHAHDALKTASRQSHCHLLYPCESHSRCSPCIIMLGLCYILPSKGCIRSVHISSRGILLHVHVIVPRP